MRLGYRQQWVGFEGAPTTGWASVHGTIRPKARGFQANKHGLGTFTAAKGAATLTATGQSGATSYSTDEDTDVITTKLGGKNYQLASVWFYDDAADTSVQSMARVDEGPFEATGWRGLGVNTSVSTTRYVYRVDGTSSAGTVPRTTGWHQATWDYRSGSGVTMSIDGQAVATAAEQLAAEHRLERGDPAAHRRLIDAQHLGGSGEAARSLHGQEHANVGPVEHGPRLSPPRQRMLGRRRSVTSTPLCSKLGSSRAEARSRKLDSSIRFAGLMPITVVRSSTFLETSTGPLRVSRSSIASM